MHEYSERWQHGVPWNKGKLIGQKAPLELKEIWAIRIRLQAGTQNTRPCPLQSRARQQATRMRSRSPARM